MLTMDTPKPSRVDRREMIRERAREVAAEQQPAGIGDVLEGDQLLTLEEAAARYRVTTRMVRDAVREGRFPKPVHLFGKRWRLSDLTAWEAAGGYKERRGRPRR